MTCFLVRVPKFKLALRSLYSSGKLKLDFQKPSLISSIWWAILGAITVPLSTVPKCADTVGVVLQRELSLQGFVISTHPIAEREFLPVLKNQDTSCGCMIGLGRGYLIKRFRDDTKMQR